MCMWWRGHVRHVGVGYLGYLALGRAGAGLPPSRWVIDIVLTHTQRSEAGPLVSPPFHFYGYGSEFIERRTIPERLQVAT